MMNMLRYALQMWKILAIAQDVLYLARLGRVKTPKHVLLPVAVYHLTRSPQVVDLLHKFGHGMSHNQVQGVDTAFAEQAIANDDQVQVPSNIILPFRSPSLTELYL